MVDRHAIALYRFGIEEAVADIGRDVFRVRLRDSSCSGGFSSLRGFLGLAGAAFIVFTRFGYLYAGVAAVLFAGDDPVQLRIFGGLQADTPRRLMAIVILLVIFGLARERRKDHDWEFPGDLYGVLETTAWAAIYVLTNLKISAVAVRSRRRAAVLLGHLRGHLDASRRRACCSPIRDRHRWMLDANIVMAIVTMMSNKPYLGGVQKPWDPILFGVLMIAIALGLKRWLASGADGSRGGFIAERLLASERERLAVAGGAAALAPGAPAPHSHPSPRRRRRRTLGRRGASGKF